MLCCISSSLRHASASAWLRASARRQVGSVKRELLKILGAGVTVLSPEEGSECDGNIIALYKPSGLLSHPGGDSSSGSSSSGKCLLQCRYDHREECYYKENPADGEVQRYYLCHRLDSATSGLIVLALGKQLAHALKDAFRRRWVRKHYQARCFGSAQAFERMMRERDRGRVRGGAVGTSEMEWIDEMAIAREAGKMRAVHPSEPYSDQGRAMTARTNASLSLLQPAASPSGDVSIMLDLRPLTGYTHQLRYQCYLRGLPIVGDKTYGDKSSFAANRSFASGRAAASNRLFLHSRSLFIEYSSSGGTRNRVFSAEAPTPPEFLL